MNKIGNKILLASLSVVLFIAIGCKDDNDLQYNLILADLKPDKTAIAFNANANEAVIMTNPAKGSTWFVRKEGDVPTTILQTTDRVLISVAINDAVTTDGSLLKERTGKVILSEETAGGLVVDKFTIPITQSYYREPGSTGLTDWDNGNPPSYSWTNEGKGVGGQDDQVTVEGLQNGTYTYRIIGTIAKSITVTEEGEGASRKLKLSAEKNTTGKVLRGFILVTDKDGKIIYTARPLVIGG